MTPPDNQRDERPGLLQSWRRIVGKMFGCKPKDEGHVSDEEIRRSVGGMSATSTHQKPGKKE
ncbi:MAG TPA: hypothetical protein V6D22_22955 [Candidatus Obscuribacterales bacterium]